MPPSCSVIVLCHGSQIASGGQNALRPIQALDLKKQRVEGGEIDKRQSPEKYPSRKNRLARSALRIEAATQRLKNLPHADLRVPGSETLSSSRGTAQLLSANQRL